MRVFGFDLSVSRIGVAHPDGSTTSITARAKAADPYRRLNELLTAVSRELRLWPGVDVVVVEGYALGAVKGRLAAIRLGEIGGAMRLLTWELGIPFVDVPPSSVKQVATGNGNASKDEVLFAARAAGARARNHDEADAWWCHEIGIRALAGDPLPEALDALPWPRAPRPSPRST